MLNIYCWRCGTGIDEHQILGLGQFDPNIGKYKEKALLLLTVLNVIKQDIR